MHRRDVLPRLRSFDRRLAIPTICAFPFTGPDKEFLDALYADAAGFSFFAPDTAAEDAKRAAQLAEFFADNGILCAGDAHFADDIALLGKRLYTAESKDPAVTVLSFHLYGDDSERTLQSLERCRAGMKAYLAAKSTLRRETAPHDAAGRTIIAAAERLSKPA